MVKMQIESNKLALKTNYDQKKRLVGGRRNQNGLVVTVVSELEYKYIDLHIYNEHVTWDNKNDQETAYLRLDKCGQFEERVAIDRCNRSIATRCIQKRYDTDGSSSIQNLEQIFHLCLFFILTTF